MEVHVFHSTDVYLNLALEQELFLSLKPGESRLLLWKNDPCVVMGRFQNPWLECDLGKMKKSGVRLARRQSGGGTVYHDNGNVNISFLDWNEAYDKNKNNEVLIRTLKAYGHEALTSGRSDIQIKSSEGNKKVSGAAFKQKKDRSFHHCTMLLNSDLDELNSFLLPRFRQDQVKTKAIASVRSKVANIEVGEQEFFDSVMRFYEEVRGQKAKVVYWRKEEASNLVGRSPEYLEKLRSWNWIFGETPLFETNLVKGGWNVKLAVKKGIVREVELEHEGLHPSFLRDASLALTGESLTFGIKNRLTDVEGSESYVQEISELIRLLGESFTVDFLNGSSE